MEPPSRTTICVLNPRGYRTPREPISAAIQATLQSEAALPSDVRVLLASDDELQELNLRFRGIDSPTDVLTFPEGEAASGDIAIAVPYARRQARQRGIDPEDEIVFLAIHGALHLLGFEDQTEAGYREMVDRADRLMKAL